MAAASKPKSSIQEIPPDRRMTGQPDDPATDDQGQPETPNAGVDVAEYLSIPGGTDGDDSGMIDLPDGSSIATIGEDTGESEPSNDNTEFYANLAEIEGFGIIMGNVATDLLRKIEDDKEARKKRDEQYEEGIKRTGLGKDAPGGAEFEGASRVVHPMITEACIDYESRIIKELFPPSGPVKAKIIGTPTHEKAERAERKVEHMNWQISTQIKEAFSVVETTLTQVPLGGVQYIKQWWDHRLSRPKWQFVPVDSIYLPFSAADFQSAHRKTFAEKITDIEFKYRVDSERYRDVQIGKPSQIPEESKAEKATNKVEGREDPGMNIDGERVVYEVQVVLEVTEDMTDYLDQEEPGKLYPYLISIDETSRSVVSWYRDWEPEDDTREAIEHIFEFPFVPWRGAYSIGFPQIIGGLSAAATGALRALLDSAHVNNAPSGLIKKGSGTSGQSIRPQIGTMTEIDTGLEADDIRKVAMPFPFNPPSTVLFQLLGFLVDAGKGTVRTSLDETTVNANSNVPVGTQLSRVEEGLVVFSSIHGRIHKAFNRLLAGLHRLNKLYLPEELQVDREGHELLVRRSDYDGPCDVQAVSDPTIYSDQQRMWQITAIQQRSDAHPGLYKAREVEKRFLTLMKVVDPDELLTDAPQPHELNAVNEGLSLASGQPTLVFPEQDHLAHLQVHLDFTRSPVLGMNPLIAPVYLPAALKHIAQHVVMFYVAQTVKTVEAASGKHVAELMSNNDQVKAEFDKLLAQASQHVIPMVEKAVSGGIPVVQQAMAILQQLAPKPPVDPNVQLATQAEMQETGRKAAADQADNSVQVQRNAIAAQRNQITQEGQQIAANTKITTTSMDNEAAQDIASSRIASGRAGGFSDGRSLEGG